MCCVGVGAAEDRPAWGRAILISGAHQEHDVLRATFTHATSRGVETQAAAATLKTLNKYIHQRVAQGKTVTLSQGMMVDTLEAAQRARWSPQDTSDLLLALQADMDAAPRPPVAQFRLAIARVRDGGTVAEAMGTAGLENRAAR